MHLEVAFIAGHPARYYCITLKVFSDSQCPAGVCSGMRPGAEYNWAGESRHQLFNRKNNAQEAAGAWELKSQVLMTTAPIQFNMAI